MICIAGPCVVENEKILSRVAEVIVSLQQRFPDIQFYFKSSYKKANRTKYSSFQGIDRQQALKLLQDIRMEFRIPVLTDVHESWECEEVSQYVDVLQIPAFLCRQTDLLLAAAKTGKPVNIKKGQFMSPESMAFAVEKVRSTGNQQIWLTERGTTFGYERLVVDMTGIPEMKKHEVPVIIDVTHSLQRPNQDSGVTGGKREMIQTIALAGIAAGADGIFVETHPSPPTALSDAATQLPLDELPLLIERVKKLYDFMKTLTVE
ncbi:MAG: 3-deoxy-8-phosphooctulonate synthase [Bacteroidales bacterium]|nr:3-deoxy-8-phosphooctulonate synthase [Bacteroidales bacterium]